MDPCSRPFNSQLKQQGGFVLLLMVLVFMGLGGVVLASIGQQAKVAVDRSRFEHNQEVLQQAKAALLLYAYNYPNFNDEGPGRLPCPDTNNDGVGDLTAAACVAVGRFPFVHPDMEFYDARDADNQRLWFAVSDNFDILGGGPIINSASTGSITVYDQTGALLYDGNGAGVAAVIIAPGMEMEGQDRAADANDPANFLETFDGYSNSAFVNGSSANTSHGFRLGPVVDAASNTLVINDQMVFITREELLSMARSSVLEYYREAVNDYRANTGRYPWLDDYSTTDLLNFDAETGTGRGRVPAIFGQLFSGEQIDAYTSQTRFRFEPNIQDPGLGVLVAAPVIDYLPPQPHTDVSFNVNGDLVTSVDSSAASVTLRFWDGHPDSSLTDPNSPIDNIWELCTGTAGTGVGGTGNPEDDCNRKTDGTFKAPADATPDSSDVWLQVIELTYTFNSGVGRFVLSDAFNPSQDITDSDPPAVASHAVAYGTYTASIGWTVDWKYDLNFRGAFDTSDPFPVNQSGALVSLKAGITYYPELPAWARDNRWHHVMQMIIDDDYYPGGNNTDCTATGSCLTLLNRPAPNDDLVSLLVLADADTDLVDDGAVGFTDDIEPLFATENDFSNAVYDRLAGNDKIMVLQ